MCYASIPHLARAELGSRRTYRLTTIHLDMTRSHMLSRAATPLVNGHTPYSVATLVKLLLDCPEHIWRCIERQDYLSAARLDSIGRAVYRELVNAGKRKATPKPRRRSAASEEDDEDSGGYDSDEEDDETGDLLAAFPLVEQQFDTLDGLAPQISSRATSHLRSWDLSVSVCLFQTDEYSPAITDVCSFPALQNVAEALATLLMLDRISVADGLDLLLEQRSKSLSALLLDSASPKATSLRRPSTMMIVPTPTAMPVSRTASQAGEGKAIREAVHRTTDALSLILATHEHVMQCFTKTTANEEPRLLHLLRLVQQSTTASAESPNTTLSMVQAQASSSKTHSDSLQPIIATLPNAHLFLRYLPEQILTFTPYIDIDSAESEASAEHVREKLANWFENALQVFETGVGRLFNAVTSASQLADARRTILESIAKRVNHSDELLQERSECIKGALDAALGLRYTDIYTKKLDNIAHKVPEALDAALRALETSPEDLHPNVFLFSASLPFPTLSIFSGASSNAIAVSSLGKMTTIDPFTLFKQAIEIRVLGRSPVLCNCLEQVETLALELKTDMLAWLDTRGDPSTRDFYIAAAKQSISTIEETLRDTLSKQEQNASQLFIGSIAAHLAMDSTFVQALLLLPDNQGKCTAFSRSREFRS